MATNRELYSARETYEGTGKAATDGRIEQGYGDQTGVHPIAGTEKQSIATAGGKSINTFGASVGSDLVQGTDNEYGQFQEFVTPAGHSVEYNDTPGSERIMIRHTSGTGINFGPDGSIIISDKRRNDAIAENYVLSVSGQGELTFGGNLTIKCEGDFNLDVGGTFNVNAAKYTQTVTGPSAVEVYGDDERIVSGNQNSIVLGGGNQVFLAGNYTSIKGNSSLNIEGTHLVATSGALTMTSAGEIAITSPEANIAADNLSVFGDTGTIGGENMQMYTKNLRANKTVYATESVNTKTLRATTSVETHTLRGTVATLTRVNADLNGNALTATTAGTSLHQSYNDGTYVSSSGTGVSPGSYTPGLGTNPNYTVDTASLETAVEDDTTETALPTSTLMTDYRTKGSRGVRVVQIDPGDHLKNNIDKTEITGGISNRELTARENRSKFRDPATRQNAEYIASQQSAGNLSANYATTAPENIRNILPNDNLIVQGQTPLGNPDPYLTSKRFKA